MSRSPNSHPELRELGTFLGTIERGGNPRAQAFNHNLGRNVRVVQLLTVIGLLRKAGKPLTGTVTCIKAERQNFSSDANMVMLGHAMGSMQAAHFMPGTIYVAGTPVWQFASDLDTRGHIEALFAAVEHLPTVFNQADTAAEAKGQGTGLCAALAAACQTLLAGATFQAAFQTWTIGANVGLLAARNNKTALGVLPGVVRDPDGNIDFSARESASGTMHNRDDAVRILGYYLEDQDIRDWNWVATDCKSAIGDITRAFKG